MSNLLDRSSLVLTPTAYNNGEALCIKPDDASGDFTFSRNSAATRVNAQGLVENVQILSSNLVQNGDFSEEGVEEVSNGSFSQEGVQQISNGSFDTDSNWTKGTGWSISGGSANCDGTQSVNTFLKQQGGILGANIDFVVGKTYKVNFDIIVTSGQISNVEVASSYDSNAITTSGNHTTYITAVSTNDRFTITANPDFIGSIDNVSVREVGQDWDFVSTSELTEQGARIYTPDGSYTIVVQNNVLVVGKQYKVTFDVIATDGSSLSNGSGSVVYDTSTIGSKVFYITTDEAGFALKRISGVTDVTITNISVKEVGQNWDIGDGWSISNLGATCSDLNNNLTQDVGVTAGELYKVTLDITDYTSGTLTIDIGGSSNQTATSLGSKTFYFTTTSTGLLRFYGGSFRGTITNISVIEITTETSLPRISYENFSYQDALGSEQIVNGSFDSDTAWTKGAGWSIANGTATYDGTGGTSALIQNGVIEINKTYKVTIDVISNEGSGINTIFLGNNAINTQHLEVGSYTFYGASTSGIGLAIYGRSGEIFKIDNVSVKEYFGQSVVPDSGCGSWLWEPQTTQLLPNSEAFSQWGKGADITIEGGYLAPDGNNTAYKVTKTGISTPYLTDNRGLTATTTRSIFARTISGTGTATLLSHNSNTNNTFTLTEQWQRFELSDTASSTGLTTFYAADFRGSGTLTEYLIWGANATNDQDYATSYIPSNGSQVTRNQDVCTNGATGTGLINSTEGVLYAEIAALADDGTNRYITLNSGVKNDSVRIYYNSLSQNQISIQVRSTNNVQAIYNYTLSDVRDFVKVAILYKLNEFKMYVNGSLVYTDTSGLTPIGLSELDFDSAGAEPFFGKTKCLAVWKEALSDAELTELTTI